MQLLPPTTLATASVTLLNYLLTELGPDQPTLLGGGNGLPAGALECLEHNLVVAATPIVEPLFDAALERFAAASKRDVLLVRHGFYPETIDPVRIDVALRSITGPILVCDTSLWRGKDGGLHLVPARPDLYVEVGRNGLAVRLTPPWDRWDDRTAGLEQAAAEIVRACRASRRG